jgi:hypothetical protein
MPIPQCEEDSTCIHEWRPTASIDRQCQVENASPNGEAGASGRCACHWLQDGRRGLTTWQAGERHQPESGIQNQEIRIQGASAAFLSDFRLLNSEFRLLRPFSATC